MRLGRIAAAVALALMSTAGSACTMGQPGSKAADCRVTGAELLPAEVGGADAVCAAIAGARTSAGTESVTVEVQVLSPHLMVATQTRAGGESLPEVRTARSDRPLGTRSIQMLADALAAQLAAKR